MRIWDPEWNKFWSGIKKILDPQHWETTKKELLKLSLTFWLCKAFCE